MTFGMILLILVMALSLAGSLIPQGQEQMAYVNRYGAQGARWVLGAGLNDVFHTWYFYALEALLCVNLLLCSVVRFPRARGAAARLRERAWEAEADHPLPAEGARTLDAFLTARRFRAEKRGEAAVYAKNAAGFYGSFLVHASILLVLLFGTLALVTPEIRDRTVMPGETLTLEDGTRLTCLSFHIEDETGRLDYASVLLAQSADGRTEKRQEIRVNEPMRFGAYKIYQQTYGTAGRVRTRNTETGAEDVLWLTEPCFLTVDKRSGIFFEALYPGFLRDAEGNYTLVTRTDRSYPDPVYSVKTLSEGTAASVLAFPGEEITVGGIGYTFLEPAEYPGLRIKHISPWLFGGLYFGFFLMVAALYLCFFVSPVCVKVAAEGYAAVSPKSRQGLLIELEAALKAKEEE